MAVSFFHRDVGRALKFIIVSGDTVKDITGGQVTLLTSDRQTRSVSLVSATSGTCEYTLVAGDFPAPVEYQAQLIISVGGETVYTSAFTMTAKPTLDLFGP